jgi:hypothetical protein
MVQTDLDVCNLAISRIGGETIDILDETSPAGAYCVAQYPQARDWCLGKYRWSFASAIGLLTQLGALPPGCPAPFAYALPSDLIGAVHSYRTAPDPRQGTRIRAMLVSNAGGDPQAYVAAHQSPAWAEYTQRVTEALWPVWFVEFVKTVFASGMASAVGQNTQLASQLFQIAFGTPAELGEGGLYAQCRNEDARNAPPRELYQDPWDEGQLVSARWGYGFPWGYMVDFPFVGLPGSFGGPTFINFPNDQGG